MPRWVKKIPKYRQKSFPTVKLYNLVLRNLTDAFELILKEQQSGQHKPVKMKDAYLSCYMNDGCSSYCTEAALWSFCSYERA